MIPTFLSLLAQILQPAAGSQLAEGLSPQMAAEQVSQCGLGPVTIKFEEEIQSFILVPQGSASSTDEQLKCADTAAGIYDLGLPEAVLRRFYAIRSERVTALAVLAAKKWLTEHRLLDRVPKYEKGLSNDAAFVRSVERLCGPRARGAFRSAHGPHALSPTWIEREGNPGGSSSHVLACLLNVTTFAGFEVGFVGNEAYLDPSADEVR